MARACRGELPEELAAAHERQARGFEALQRAAASLADSLERALPALPRGATRIHGEGGISLVTRVQASPLAPLNILIRRGAAFGFEDRAPAWQVVAMAWQLYMHAR